MKQVSLGSGGVLAGGREGLIVVGTSTISPLTSQRIAATLAERGVGRWAQRVHQLYTQAEGLGKGELDTDVTGVSLLRK